MLTSSEPGFYAPELVHPLEALEKAGCHVTICNLAGKAPITESSITFDDSCKEFWAQEANRDRCERAPLLSTFKGSDFKVVFFVGGFGTMHDFPQSSDVSRVGVECYESGGIVSAVCHGPISLTNMVLSDGSYLVAGKEVAAFTNEEEAQAGLLDTLPLHDG